MWKKVWNHTAAKHNKARNINLPCIILAYLCVYFLFVSALTNIRFDDNDMQGAQKYSRLALILGVTGIIATILIATTALGVSAYIYYREDDWHQ